MLTRRHLRLVVSVVILIASYAAIAEFDADLDEIFKNIESEDVLLRRSARKALSKYLDNLDESKRPVVVKELLDLLPSSNYQRKLGICYGIGYIKEFFWTVDDQEDTKENLYNLFKKENDSTLKKRMDRALMKAEGLYWHAINDYNNDKVEESVEKKFERVFDDYPASTSAQMAHYYLARYYRRAYFVLKYANKNPELEEWIEKSNDTFEDFLEEVKDSKYQAFWLMDARYFLALNFVLLDEFDKAIDELKKIEKASMEKASMTDERIYVYQFYRQYVDADIVEKYFPATELARHTREYLEQHPSYNGTYLRPFIDYLKKFSP